MYLFDVLYVKYIVKTLYRCVFKDIVYFFFLVQMSVTY